MTCSLAVLVVAVTLAGCATPRALPPIDGEAFAPGVHAFDTQRENAREADRLEPWEPSPLYPTLAAVEPAVGGTRPAQLPARVPRHTTSRGPTTAAAWLWYSFYKQTMSKVDGNTCRFHPSCSTFALQAIREHGPLGLAMAFGRLHKNHGNLTRYPMVHPPFLEDPVANYGFWARTPALDDFAAYENEAFAWYQHLRAVRRLSARPTPSAPSRRPAPEPPAVERSR